MPKLTVYQADGNSVKYGLNGKSFTVGRAETNDIVLPGGSASSHHASLKASDSGNFVVTDFDSTNHTRVNGEIVQSKALEDGDELHFGDILALYSSEIEAVGKSRRAAPKFEEEEEEEAPVRSRGRAQVEETDEPAPKARNNPAANPRPGARRGGPAAAGPGGLVQAPPAPAASMSSGEGCFALFMLMLLAASAFTLGIWLRHQKDHNGQSLPEYVTDWRKSKMEAEAAKAK